MAKFRSKAVLPDSKGPHIFVDQCFPKTTLTYFAGFSLCYTHPSCILFASSHLLVSSSLFSTTYSIGLVTIPGISVILPCYNHYDYLRARIYSVLNQTISPSEIIFLDDASTDDSFQLANSLLSVSTIDVSFYRNKFNSGSPFSQWNKGVLLAKHPIIWIAETDDTCELCFLEHLSTTLLHNDAVLVYAQSSYISESSNYLGSAISYTSTTNLHLLQHDFAIKGADYNRSFMTKRNSIPNASAVLFCRATYINVGLANISMRYCGDWDMWIRLAAQGSIAFVADELNHFRCHNLTTRSKGNTPRFAAEAMACRLSARIIPSSSGSFTVTALWLFRQYSTRKSIGFSSMFCHIHLSSFFDVYHNYCSLTNQPRLTHGAWLVIFTIIVYDTITVTAKRIVNLFANGIFFRNS